MHHYYRARSFAEQNHAEFEMQPWLGEMAFKNVTHFYTDAIPDLVVDGTEEFLPKHPYDRPLARSYFQPLVDFGMPSFDLVIHLRRGDLVNSDNSFPFIGIHNYRTAIEKLGFKWIPVVVTDDVPFQFWKPDLCHPDWAHLLDFEVMLKAKNLFIANSGFSWWAGLIGFGNIYQPVNGCEMHGCLNCDFQLTAYL